MEISLLQSDVLHPETGHQSVKSRPIKPEGREFYLRSGFLLDNGRDRMLAINLMRVAASRYPNDQQILWRLGNLLAKAGKNEEELLIRQHLYKTANSFTTTTALGYCLYRRKNFEEALAIFFESLSLQREDCRINFDLFLKMGICCLQVKDIDGAEEYFHKALLLDRRKSNIFVCLGTLEFQKGNFRQAHGYFHHAIELDKTAEKAWVGIAMIHLKLGDYELGVANLKRALDLDSGNRTALHLLCSWGRSGIGKTELCERIYSYLYMNSEDSEMSLVIVQFLCEIRRNDLALLEILKNFILNPQSKEWQTLFTAIHETMDVPASRQEEKVAS